VILDIASIAGLWEDPSAVFIRTHPTPFALSLINSPRIEWKHNPVSFDSVFNQSSTTFSFGSPDILKIFAPPPVDGNNEDDSLDEERKILMWMYNGDDEDFTSGMFPFVMQTSGADIWVDATTLDYFVLDKFKAILERAKTDAALDKRLRSRHTVFFLHLHGLDTTGHGYGPHSKVSGALIGMTVTLISLLCRNTSPISRSWGIVKDVETMIKEYYRDDRTAFLFT
jgi:phosphatidylinositol glycan class N